MLPSILLILLTITAVRIGLLSIISFSVIFKSIRLIFQIFPGGFKSHLSAISEYVRVSFTEIKKLRYDDTLVSKFIDKSSIFIFHKVSIH